MSEWAAGLFEGEGSIGHKVAHRGTRTYKYPRLQLAMTDEDVVRRFHEVVGEGRVNGPYRNQADFKPYWAWAAQNSAAERVMARLLPHLGARRSARWAEVLRERGRVKEDA